MRGQSSITQHIFCRGENQLESLQRLLPPEAICPYTTFCAAHCTCPFYLSVTVPCLSFLSIILSPSLLSFSVYALCSALSHYTLSISLSFSTFPIQLTVYLSFGLFPSLSLLCLLLSPHICWETRQCSKWGALTPAVVFRTEDITHFVPLPL